MFDLMQGGAIKMCWISGTNPAVSFVNLEKMRAILGMPGLFIVAQDIFETETTQLADVVLPAAMWGEKTGCFTNVGASDWYEPGIIFERRLTLRNDHRPYRSHQSQGNRTPGSGQGMLSSRLQATSLKAHALFYLSRAIWRSSSTTHEGWTSRTRTESP